MRTFTVDSIFDGEHRKWMEIYMIDNQEVQADTYFKQLEIEERLENDNIEMSCQCVNCKSARGEFTEQEETEIGLVEYYASLIEEIQCSCGCQLRNTLYKLVQECVAMGYEEASEKMRKFIDE